MSFYKSKRAKFSDSTYDENIWNPLLEIKGKYYKKYITGTDIKNYLLADPILDWLNIHYSKKYNNFPTKTNEQLLFSKGNEFEKQIYEFLKNKFENDFVLITENNNNKLNEENYLKTLSEIKKGTPIIAQGVLLNDCKGIGGIPDLIVRSDYINKLTKKPSLKKSDIKKCATKLNSSYHYLIIDIKWSTFVLCSDTVSIRNENRIPSYKGQLALYNILLGEIQGYIPQYTFILANHFRLDSQKNEPVIFDWDYMLGEINYNNFDNKYIEKTKDAILWLNKLTEDGEKWDIYNPTIPELYPNMSNTNDSPWSTIKKEIAVKIDEITQIWYVGVTNRTSAHSKNVFKWSDTNCTSEVLDIRGSQRVIAIDKILEINRSSTEIFSPKKIENNLFEWNKKNKYDFYVDFETIPTVLSDSINIEQKTHNNDMIFMIGVGYEIDEKWGYKVFTCNDITLDEENRIITDFFNFMYEMYNEEDNLPIRIFHWHNAEVLHMAKAEERHDNKWIEYENSIIWIDMCKIFIDEPIVVKGSFNFKLKDIVYAMDKNNLISIKWPKNGPVNGFDAMIDAIKYYENKKINENTDTNVIKSIEEYNNIDCKSVWEIVNYLRKNHC